MRRAIVYIIVILFIPGAKDSFLVRTVFDILKFLEVKEI